MDMNSALKMVILVHSGANVVAVIRVPDGETDRDALIEAVKRRLPRDENVWCESRSIIEAEVFEMWADIHYGEMPKPVSS